MLRIFTLLIALPVLLLTACSDEGDSRYFGLSEPGPGSTEYGEPHREEGEITVEKRDDVYVASQRLIIRNGFGGALAASVDLHTPDGGVLAVPGPAGRYELQVLLEGEGDDPEAARAALDEITLQHSDSRDSGTSFELSAQAVFGEVPTDGEATLTVGNVSLLGPGTMTCRCRAYIGALLPPEAFYAMSVSTALGSPVVSGLNGVHLTASSELGGIQVRGEWGLVLAVVETGSVDLRGRFGAIDARVHTGYLSAHLDTDLDLDGNFEFGTGNAEIYLRQNNSSIGFDLLGEVSTGHTEISVRGTTELENQAGRVHKRTPDFDSRPHQVTLTVTGDTGDITITD